MAESPSEYNDDDPELLTSPLSPRQSNRSMSHARSVFTRRSTLFSPEKTKDMANGIRFVELNDYTMNDQQHFISNVLRTAKYTPLNMIPKALLEQFRRFSNFYFLVIAGISFIPDISPSTPLANVLPLFIVVGFGFFRDIYEDTLRSVEDSKQNNEKQIIMARIPDNIPSISKSLSPINSSKDTLQLFNNLSLDPDLHRFIASKNISVGDIVLVKKDQVFPCDLLLLYSSNEGGISYVSTANLDGESNLKRVICPPLTKNINSPSQLISLIGKVRAQKPTTSLYEFEASMELNNKKDESVPLDASNLLLRASILKNTDYIYGLTIYTGFDTKVALNMRNPPSKMGSYERKLNSVVLFLFILLALLVIGFAIAAGVLQSRFGSNQWYMGVGKETTGTMTFLRSLGTFLILFSTFIPVSLFVTLEFIRLLQALFMSADFRMKTKGQSVVARATNLNEMLGEVEHVLSDKTGTLTENIMRYIACSTNGTIYNTLEDSNIMQRQVEASNEHVRELILGMSLCHSVVPEAKDNSSSGDEIDENLGKFKKFKKKVKDTKNSNKNHDKNHDKNHKKNHTDNGLDVQFEGAIDDIHHEDQPESDNTDESTLSEDSIEYQGQSPDEVALVTSARDYGVALVKRTLDTMTINHFGIKEQYTMIAELEFNSDRKRMSMIVKGPNGKIVMYTKGADTIMIDLLKSDTDVPSIQNHIDEFAKQGLRTLVYAKKDFHNVDEFNEWFQRFQDARNSLENRDEKVSEVSKEIEKDLDYIATTAVEDKLQDMVPETIKFLREADIKLWVLTGDKRETAENIGYSANLLDRNMDVVHIEGNNSDEVGQQLHSILDNHVNNNDNSNSDLRRQASSLNSMASKLYQATGFSSPKRRVEEKEIGIIIDGKSLSFAIDDHSDLFLEVSDHTKVVICARVTPLQKALVVRLVKNKRLSMTLAIGDGGNDVSMIQEAHIGVGIFGKEGTQAARSADYALGEFKHILRLLVLHGRYSGLRTAGTINLSFYKNIVFTMTQVFFQIFDFSTGLTYNNQWITSGFNVVVTSLSPFLYGIFERDLEEDTLIRFPSTYKLNRDRKLFSLRSVIEYALIYGLWHSITVFFGVYLMFGLLKINFTNGLDSGLTLNGFVNSTLVVCMTLFKFVLHSSTQNWIVIFAIILSFLIHIAVVPAAIYIVGEYSLEGQLEMLFSSPTFYLCSFVIFVTGYFAEFGIMLTRKLFFPNVVERLQKWERQLRINTKKGL